MATHHDSKGRRIKIYIWLNKKNYDTHPLFYLKSSNKKITFWKNYNQTRYLDIDDNTMSKIYGDLGKIIIFDTTEYIQISKLQQYQEV